MAFNFDSNDYDTSSVGQSFTVLPAGMYKAVIDSCSLEPGKTTEGSTNIKIVYSVLEGDFKGQKIFQNIVYENPSNAAVEIGRKMLAKVCKCANKPVLYEGPEELAGSQLFVDVVVKKYNDKDTNNVYNVYGVDPITNEAINPDSKVSTQQSGAPLGFGVQSKK